MITWVRKFCVSLYILLLLNSSCHAQLFRWPFVRLRSRISNSITETARMTGNDVSFNLFPDPGNKDYHERLMIGDIDGLKSSNFNPELPIILFIHGFLHSYATDFSQTLKNAYLEETYPANIVAVDWGPLATPPGPPNLNYHVVVEKVPVVGNAVAQFIRYLIKNRAHGISGPDKVHIVGFSLGAHIAGIAGYHVLQSGISPIARITGLDPAGPLFQSKDRSEKLDSTDAHFVDVVHTNQGMKGYSGIMGHVDFYPNGGGPYQPGCRNNTHVSDVFTGTCSHARAYKFFARSIKDKYILACKCTNENPGASRTFIEPLCMLMCDKPIIFGQHCPTNARGVYHVDM